jgi:hypothetical protein
MADASLSSKPTLVFDQANSQSMQSATGVAISGTSFAVITVWQMNNATQANGRLVSYAEPSAFDYQSGSWVMSRTGTGTDLRADPVASGFFSTGGISHATTYYLAMTVDTTNATFYLNNVQVNQVASVSNSIVTAGALGVGEYMQNAAAGGSNYWDGAVSEVINQK